MIIYHRKSIANSCLQELVMNEYDEKIYNSDLLRVSGSNCRMNRYGLTISDSRSTLVKKDSVLLD